MGPAVYITRRSAYCRYLLRPAVAQDPLRLTEDGRVVLELKTQWADGTSHLVFDPLDFLARLASLTPRQRINVIFYHGLLAPNARHRGAGVAYGAPPVASPPPAVDVCAAPDPRCERGANTRPSRRNWTWAQLTSRR